MWADGRTTFVIGPHVHKGGNAAIWVLATVECMTRLGLDIKPEILIESAQAAYTRAGYTWEEAARPWAN